MAGGMELADACGKGAKSHETRKETHGEREGTTASSPRAKIGGGDGSETAATRTARTVVGGAPPCGSCGRDEAKMERGQQEGARGGARLPFNEAEGAGARGGGAPTTRVERARLRPRLDRDGGCGRKVGELTGGGRASAAGRGRRRAATVGGRVGRRGLLGRTAEARDRAGAAAGLGCGAGPRGKKWPWGRKSRKRGKEEFFLFFFQTNFPKAF